MKGSRFIALAYLLSAAASIGLAIVYVAGGQPQLEGALLGVALGGIAIGLTLLAKEFLPHGPFVQERDIAFGDEEQQEDVEEAFTAGTESLERRSFLTKLLGLAFGALGVAAVFPIRSLGTRPRDELFETAWTEGVRLVTETGAPVKAASLPVNGVLTVFPEGHTDAADSQSLVINLPDDVEAPGPEGASVDGLVAFSKICTHAGCPVGLYQAETKELFCPCHQSAFAVLQAAEPVAGPATRPLPQLPIGVNEDGDLVALGDFPEPVGPGFWNRGRD
ncbi:MAG: Rieske 2Fe-2S domain-containing protein [Actinomycetota bacterium]